MPSSLLVSSPQLSSTCGWGMLYSAQETAKPRHLFVLPAAAAKKPAVVYSGGKERNLETCTEALGCETGGVGSFDDGGVEMENAAERKRRTREEEEEMVIEGSACQSARHRGGRGPLPPPLTTLALGTSRVPTVHERRGGRLKVYAVRSPGILEAERSDGRLRLRIMPLLCGAGNDDAAECRRQEAEQAEKEDAIEVEHEQEEAYGGFVKKFVRRGRCVHPEAGAAAATAVSLGKQWEPEQAAAFLVATS